METNKDSHTLQDDWKHFLSYSGYWKESDEVKAKLLLAFGAAWEDNRALQTRLTLTETALAAVREYLATLEAETDGTDFIPYGKAKYHAALARLEEVTK